MPLNVLLHILWDCVSGIEEAEILVILVSLNNFLVAKSFTALGNMKFLLIPYIIVPYKCTESNVGILLLLIPFIVKSVLHILPDNTYSKSDDIKLGYFALRNISSIYPSLSNIDNII